MSNAIVRAQFAKCGLPLPAGLAEKRGKASGGSMNGLERAYAQHLDLRRTAGEVEWYAYEWIKLRLADGAFYTPDFAVKLATGEFQIVECKGTHWREAAKVRIKVAADRYPFTFLVVTKDGEGWRYQSVGEI